MANKSYNLPIRFKIYQLMLKYLKFEDNLFVYFLFIAKVIAS